MKHTTYTQQYKVFAAAAILTSSFYNFDQRTVMKVGETTLAEFLDSLIVYEAEIVAILLKIGRLSVSVPANKMNMIMQLSATSAVTSL